MKLRLLITGGAGFIGSHLADELLAHGHRVRVLDNLDPCVHGGDRRPAYQNPDVELVIGDVRDGDTVDRALAGVDAVFHLAAVVASGDHNDEIGRCTSANNVGTAILLDRLVRRPVERLIVASSMGVYGEGLYRDPSGAVREVRGRTVDQLERAEWEPWAAQHLHPMPTPETKTASVASAYAASKYDQERTCLRFGEAFKIPTVALRFFNVFGARQSTSCPYGGDLARFASLLAAGERPLVPEDGGQRRDFIPVRDAVVACRLALRCQTASQIVVNVASGQSFSLAEVAQRMATLMGSPNLSPELTGNYQVGDVRHCFADVGRARRVLGYRPSTDMDWPLLELTEWALRQRTKARLTKSRTSDVRTSS
jgi:dTDP-L-rhamnose 4-epimerase